MTLELYPVTPLPARSIIATTEYKTDVSSEQGGDPEIRYLRWNGRSKRTFYLTYNALAMTDAERNMISNFFQSRLGKAERFDYIDFGTRKWSKVYVGVGTGSEHAFDLPCFGGTSLTYYVNDTSVAGTFGAGAGANGRDRVTLYSAPVLNAVIKVTFKGQIVLPVRFDDDKLTEGIFYPLFTRVSVKLKEVF
jgi:hypothetical protein